MACHRVRWTCLDGMRAGRRMHTSFPHDLTMICNREKKFAHHILKHHRRHLHQRSVLLSYPYLFTNDSRSSSPSTRGFFRDSTSIVSARQKYNFKKIELLDVSVSSVLLGRKDDAACRYGPAYCRPRKCAPPCALILLPLLALKCGSTFLLSIWNTVCQPSPSRRRAFFRSAVAAELSGRNAHTVSVVMLWETATLYIFQFLFFAELLAKKGTNVSERGCTLFYVCSFRFRSLHEKVRHRTRVIAKLWASKKETPR